MTRRMRYLVAAMAATGLTTASTVHADWHDDFNDGDTAGWTFVNHAGNPPISSVAVSGGTLILEHTLGWVDPSGSGFDQTLTGLRTDETFSDVVVRATISPRGLQTTLAGGAETANNYVYLVARSNFLNGYVLAFDWGERDFDIYRVENGIPVEHGNDPNAPQTRIHGLDLTQTYVMELSAIGDTITGRLYDADGVTLRSELVWTDGAYSSGWSGIGAYVNGDLAGGSGTFISAAFDNVSSVAIPEPASLMLIGAGAMLMFRRRRD